MAGQRRETSRASAGSRKPLVLVAVVLAQFMVVLDFTIVQIAIPSIGKEFGISISGLQWIVTAYGLTLAGFLLLSGRAGDLYGHKRLFVIGVLVFSAASLSAGLANSETMLISARVVQGLAAALASSTGLSILTAAFPEGRERNRALSVFAAVTGIGSAAGMVAGGVVTATLGWRWVFDINVPVGVGIAILALRSIPKTAPPDHKNRHLDVLGAVCVTSGLMLLVYALSMIQNHGVDFPLAIGLLMLSVLVLAAFFFVEYRSKMPLLPLGFLRRGSVFAANALALLQLGGYVGMVFVLTNYFQQVDRYSPLSTGLAFIPMSVVFLAVSGFLSARLTNRLGFKPVIISGMALQTAGYVLLAGISPATDYIRGLVVPMLVVAVGTGLSFTAVNIAALAGTKKGEEGLASGLVNTSRQIGGPIGLAVLLTAANIASSGQNGAQSASTMATGFDYAFLAAAALTGIGIAFAGLLKQEKKGSFSAQSQSVDL